MKKIFTKRLIAFLVVLGTIFIFYQACSNAKLFHAGLASQDVKQARSQGNFCLNSQALTNDSLNIIFVVDMSFSNIADLGVIAPGVTATDQPPQRFKFIRSFIDNQCVSANRNNHFAVFGFSDDVLPIGACTKAQLVAPGPLLESQIAALEADQKIDLPTKINGIGARYMKGTVYDKAIDCASSIINENVNDPTSTPAQKNASSYIVYFITDGAPLDWGALANFNRAAATADLTGRIGTLLNNQGPGKASSVVFEPIEYGQSNIAANGLELANAQWVLNLMGTLGQSAKGFLQLSSNTFDQLNVCGLISSGRKTFNDVLQFGVVNLTAKNRRGILVPDSDMDGIPDDEEDALGFIKTDPHSRVNGNQLLDGLCPRGANARDCPVPVVTGCKPNKLNLTLCDLASYNPPFPDGIDSDRDGLPDLVEILKGTLPNDPRDVVSWLDGDTDLPAGAQVLMGRDPGFPDQGLDPKLQVRYSNSPATVDQPGCPLELQPYVFKIDNIPLVHTLETHFDPNDPMNQAPFLTHAADENVIFIYYIIGQSLTSGTVTSKLKGQFVRVSYKDQIISIDPNGFKDIGPLDGNFVSGQ